MSSSGEETVVAKDASLLAMRHSCAHVLAAAVQQLWPDAQFGVGPVIDNGFYYDILTPELLTHDDLTRIESAMRKIKKRKRAFVRQELSAQEAIDIMREKNQPFKVELLELLRTKGSTAIAKAVNDDHAVGLENDSQGLEQVSFYTIDSFIDLCRGPHAATSADIGHFSLHKLAGAYWRGDEKRPQLQRIYGLCFATKEDLEAETERLEQV